MAEFFKGQMDYIVFCSGLAPVILAAVCFALRKFGDRVLPWNLLLLFGLTQGIYEWLKILAFSLGDGPAFEAVRAGVTAISFMFLLEFGRVGVIASKGRGPGRWIHVPFLVMAALGGLAGPAGVDVFSRYGLGLVGGLLSSYAFFATSNKQVNNCRHPLRMVGVAVGLYTATVVVSVSSYPFLPASVINQDFFFQKTNLPVDFVQGLLTIWASFFIWSYLLSFRAQTTSRRDLRSRIKNTSLVSVVIITILGLGWVGTQYWGDRAFREIRENSNAHIGSFYTLLVGELKVADQSVMAMANSPWIAPALVSGDPGDIDRANSVLDRYNHSMDDSVCYLLDSNGNTIASSNRNTSESFVGMNYSFRPYFSQAIQGTAGHYFAMGVTSGRRGYYSSFPVRDRQQQIIGVAVVKRNSDIVEAYFKRYANSFFVDPNGLIFLSSRPEMLLQSLWPMDNEVRQSILESQQFGSGPFGAVLAEKFEDGASIAFEGQHYIFNREVIDPEGWSIVLLNSTAQVWINRLFCIFITLVLCVLTVVFFVALQAARDLTARITASERRYHSLVEGSPSSVKVFDLEGRFVAINRSGLQAMNWKESDVLGRKFREVWPEESRPVVDEAVGKVLGGSRCSFEAHCLRPDGSPVTWSVTLYPIYDEDGVFRNFVGISTNITERKRAEEDLRDSEAKFRTLFHSANDAILIMDGTVFVDCNSKTLEMFKCQRDEIIGKSPWQLSPDVQPDGVSSREKVLGYMNEVLDGQSRYFQWRHLRADGSVFETEISLSRIILKGNHFVQAIIRDVTERKLREEQIRLQAAALESAANAIVITDLKGHITWTNPAFSTLTGYTAGESLGLDMAILKSGKQEPEFYKDLWETILSGKVWQGEMENLHRDNSLYTEEQTITPVRDGAGNVTHFVAIKQDVTKRKQQEQQLSYLATHDPLTGLPNRRLLEDALKRAVARSRRGVVNILMFMDLDNFKLVNDTLGHASGDQVLFNLTRVIQKHLRTGDLLVRFGGDEFAVLLEGIEIEEAMVVAERMRREVEEYRFVVGEHSFHLSLSIGLAVVDGEESPGVVLSRADTAMYMAKDQGRNRVVVYRPEDGVVARLTEANQWVTRIKDAIRENRFLLFYQPLVRVSNDQVGHYEALVRMRGEDGEIIAPGEFIPVAERYGLMPQLDRWVFQQVIKNLQENVKIRLFMNLSGCSLADEGLLSFIEEHLIESGVDPGRLGFEITETAVVQDLTAAERWVRRLKALGCSFALDDFGSGFNSFIYLHSLPVDQIKIDGSYIRTLENDPTRCAMVQAMHALALSLGMETVAEFVENEAILDIVKKIGITYGQGYHLEKPNQELP